MNLLIHRNGMRLGPYSVEQAKEFLANGGLLPSDLAWHEGLPAWYPLPTLLDSLELNTPLPPPLPSADQPRVAKKQAVAEQPNPAREYRRTCRVCGKVWHSLASREAQVEQRLKSSGCSDFQFCASVHARAQVENNLRGVRSELERLRQCPNCHSTQYDEEIVDHAQQGS